MSQPKCVVLYNSDWELLFRFAHLDIVAMASIQFNQKLAPAEDVLMQHLADEAVLLNLQNEAYYGLDDVGTRMLAILQESDCIETAYQRLVEEYDVEPEVLKKDLMEFIDKLLEHGLVKINES